MIEAISIIFTLAVLFSVLNYRSLKLPNSVGLFLMGITFAVIVGVSKEIFPASHNFFYELIKDAEFKSLLLDGFLSLLLFAGAIHVNLKELDCSKWSILLFATVGVVVTTGIVGTTLYFVSPMLGLELPFLYALLFGALISPTDPVAVLAILGKSSLSKSLLVKFKGEALFNDGIGVILFSGILLIIHSVSDASSDQIASHIGIFFLKEIGGGLVLGALLGFIGYKFMLFVNDNPRLATMVSLAVVVGGYTLSHLVPVSGPLAMVTSGLVIGHKIHIDTACGKIQKMVTEFWRNIDEILNTIVFFLMGLILLLFEFDGSTLLLGIITIVFVLGARYIGIFVSFSLLGRQAKKKNKTTLILVWGGLRGGISIALALGISNMQYGNMLLLITFCVIFFAIVVQGLTTGKVYEIIFE